MIPTTPGYGEMVTYPLERPMPIQMPTNHDEYVTAGVDLGGDEYEVITVFGNGGASVIFQHRHLIVRSPIIRLPLWTRLRDWVSYKWFSIRHEIRSRMGWIDYKEFVENPVGWPVSAPNDVEMCRVFVVPWRWLARLVVAVSTWRWK